MKKFVLQIIAKLTGNGLDETADDAKKVGNKLKDADGQARGLSSTLKKIAAGAALVILTSKAYNLTKQFISMVREFAKFNTQMARASTMAKNLSFGQMRSEVMGLASALGLARDQLANGLYQSLSAGVPEDNVFDFLSNAAKVAIADGSDVAVAVDGITTVLNAFKLNADQAQHVTDLLFHTVKMGKTTFAQLAASISAAAPTAAAFKVPIDQLLASVATLTKQGVPTATAMNQIRQAMMAANDVLGEGWAQTNTLQQGLAAISAQAGGSTAAIKKLVGTDEALAAILGLTGANARGAANDLETFKESAGAADEAFKKVQVTRHWEKAQSSIEAFLGKIAAVSDAALKPLVEHFTKLMKQLNGNEAFWATFEKHMKNASKVVDGILNAFEKGQGKELAENYVETIKVKLKALMKELGADLANAIKNAIKEHGKELAVNAIKRAVIPGAAIKDAIDYFGDGESTPADTAAEDARAADLEREREALYAPGRSKNDAYDANDTRGNAGDLAAEAAAKSPHTDLDEAGATISALADDVTAFNETVKTSASNVAAAYAESAQIIDEAVEAMKSKPGESAAEYAKRTQAAADKLTQALKDDGEKVVEQSEKTGEEVTEKAEETAKAIGEAAETFNGKTDEAVTKIGGAIEGLGTGVDEISATTQTGLDEIVAGMDQQNAATLELFDRTLDAIHTAIAAANAASSKADQALSQVEAMRA